MNWFKKAQKHSVCKECGVYFEPVIGYEARWGDLCGIHRKPVRVRDETKDKVVAWASRNWERLTEQMEKETAEELTAYYDHLSKGGLAECRLGQGLRSLQGGAFGQSIFDLSGRI